MSAAPDSPADRTYVPVEAAWSHLGMSAAVRAGDFAFVSGQVATDERGEIVGEGDVEAQAEQCFANIDRLLRRLGGSLADVVALTTFLAAAEHAPAFLAVRGRRFPQRPPATTTVVAQTLSPRLLLEVQAVAAIRERRAEVDL